MKIAFTGHRDFQLTEEIKTLVLEDLQNPAVDEVIVGGAIGFDLFVGKMAREAGKPFTLVLPYPAEKVARNWDNKDKVELFLQVQGAKEVIVIEDEYSRDALFLRNKEMVELADAVVACWDERERGGTYHTVNFALSQGKSVYNIFTGKCERVYSQRTSYDIFCHDDHGEGQYQQDHLVTNLERIIYEECDYVGGKAVAAHENTTALTYFLTVDYLARKMDIPYAQAEELRDFFLVFDPDREMVETFIGWVKQRGYELARRWFSCMAIELAEAGGASSEDALERSRSGQDNEVFEPYTYHILDEHSEDYEPAWEERQPGWFIQLLVRIKRCQNLEELAELGKSVYSKKLRQDQAGVFWTQYDIRKIKLEKAMPLSAAAKTFLKKISLANGNLARLGGMLYRIQKGEIKIANFTNNNNHEWTIIWDAYNHAKKNMVAATGI